MTTKQAPPVRLDKEALAIIEKYKAQIPGNRVYPSDAVKLMDQLASKGQPNNSGMDTVVKYAGDKAYINMPKTWANKKVRVIEIKE